MRKLITLLFVFIGIVSSYTRVHAQVVTVTNPSFTTPALATTYTSLANAITALNGITAITGVVTITLNPGNPQAVPVGGYVINFTAPTTNTRRVVITGSNNTITANGSLVSGSLTDAIFKVIGVDFLTIQNFTMQENPANTTSSVATNNMTEWGVALLYASAINGAQNNTIQNNTISLNKNYSNTFGIYSNTRHTSTAVNITADVTSTAGANSSNNIYSNAISNVNMGIALIGSGDAAFMDLGNDIGGASAATANTLTNWGGIAAGSIYISNSGSCYGVLMNNQKNENVSFNNITSATVSGTSVAMRGIFKTYGTVPTGTFTSDITNNVIRINHNFSSGILNGIRSEGISTSLPTATININSNRFQTMSVLAASSSTDIVGITNTSQCGVLNINNNIFRGANSTATTGDFTAISNTGAVQTTVNINGNQIGDASGNAITFSAPTSGILSGITCPTIATGASLSISNNNFQGFVQSVAGSGAHNYITYTHAANTAITDNINGNTFTNLVANTSGDVNFIARSGTMAVLSGATDNCNNNSIVTAFSKPVAGGIVTLYNAGSGSLSGNSMVQTGNDFSNITLTGATTMNGWINTEGGLSGPTKTISNNTFNNWTCGTAAVTVITSNFGDNNTIVSNNTISSVSAAAAITGITLGLNNKGTLQTCSGNNISDLSSTGGTVLGITGGSTSVTTYNFNNNIISGLFTSNAGSSATGIRLLSATVSNVFKNKIYNISGNNGTATVNGMDVQGTVTGVFNISNNLIGDLRADLTNSTNAIRGINLLSVTVGTTYNVFYNTIYINALAGGTNFGTSAISATVSTTAANGALNLRNNILVNTSLAKGTGLTVAYRRSGTALNNFVNSSNNNIFYAGIPSATNLVFTDGTNFDQTLAAYQSRVTPRDAASFTESPTFLSTAGISANFLHLDPFINTQAENGAVNIATYTDDFDGNIRQGNVGYAGSGTAPDIGADEIDAAVVVVTNFNLTTPALSPTYASLATAIIALNAVTSMANGTVTLTLMPGNNQTAPVGGYTINTTVTSNTKLVIITGSNNTITANGSLASGSLTDAIFKVVGADFLTLQNFTMQENPANTTTAVATNNMTEWGVALLYASATNGAQNNTIQNNSISLNKTYSNTFGIYSNTRHTAINIIAASNATSTAGANSNNAVYSNTISNVNMGIAFIGSGIASFMDLGNDIGGTSVTTANTITNWGGIGALSNYVSNPNSCYGILLCNQKNENVSFNTITSATVSGVSVDMRGIYKTYSIVPTGTFTSSITNNIIGINHNFSSGMLFGIQSEGISTPLSTATININNNRFQNISVLAASSSTTIVGITSTSQCGVLNINNNIFRANTSTATTGGFTAISNFGDVQTSLNINGNQIGDASGNAITFSAATSGLLRGILCSDIAVIASLSISNNNFQGFVQNVIGSGTHSYIVYFHSPTGATTDNINNNTFTNLVANTSANVEFITRGGIMSSLAGATDNCNNNSIITGFSKPVAGGSVTLYYSQAGSLSGNTMVQTGNNFSNISLTGNTQMEGWKNYDGDVAGGPIKTINNNVFSNWTGGTGGVYVIKTDYNGNNSLISNNTISNISGSGSSISGIFISINSTGSVQTISNNRISGLINTVGNVDGISTSTPFLTNININNNTISGISGSASSSGINFISGTNANVFNNKIYDLSVNNAAATITGIIASSWNAGTSNIYNNIIGDLRADITNSQTAIIGIRIVGLGLAYTPNIYYNTININAQVGGANFGTAAIVVPTSSVANDGKFALRNNILVNTSIANGTGLTVAYRRSGTALNNYDIASNNNILYAGTPSSKNVLFTNGTSSDQTLAAYKLRVGPARDAASFTEMPPFLSTVGSSPDFLHIDPNATTQAESGAVSIATYTDDFDGDIRQGFTGYAGVGTAPDIGADEIANETTPPAIGYTTISSPICIFSGMTISGVNIKDSTGIPLSGALVPRIYFRKNAGAWFSAAGINTGGNAKNSTWSFTITEASMGGVVIGDVVSYYIIAQDIMTTPNVGANPGTGLVAANVNTVTTPPTTPNTYTISGSLNGLYTVGVGGNFTTLTAAVAAYNSACTLAGPVIFELTDNLYTTPSETFQISINNRTDASAVKTLTIRPSATAAPLIIAAGASSIIQLNGAKYVIFDGRQVGTGSVKSLTISNTGTGPTFSFINDAQNSTVKFCVIKGQSTSSISGTIFFSTANVTGTGNDNNTIDNNDITDAGSQPVYGIYSAGTASRGNDNISITNNNISNYYNQTIQSAGINIFSNSSGWTITSNRLYQDATRLYTVAATHFGIRIASGAGYTITNNLIGFGNELATGSTNMIGNSVTLSGFPAGYVASGISLNLRYVAISGSYDPGGTVSNIDGNTIGGIAMYTRSGITTQEGMLCGISVLSGNASIGTITGNTIGSTTGNNSIYVTTDNGGGSVVGIYTNSSGTVTIQNNSIGSITASGTSNSKAAGITGISTEGAANYIISNNFIGNTASGNLRGGFSVLGAQLSNSGSLDSTSGTSKFIGIICKTTGNSVTVTGNTMRGWLSSSAHSPIRGIAIGCLLSGSDPSLTINNNLFGTAATGWGSSPIFSDSVLRGVDVLLNNEKFVEVNSNDFRGIAFKAYENVAIRINGSAAAGTSTHIGNNTFTNLSIQAGVLYLILTDYFASSTSNETIDSNKTVGTFAFTGTQFGMISTDGGGTGLRTLIKHNEFSNATLTCTDGNGGVGFSIGFDKVTHADSNRVTNITHTGGYFSAMLVQGLGGIVGDTSTAAGNLISNISVNGTGCGGIDIYTINLPITGSVKENSINNLSLSRATDLNGTYVYGIGVGTYTGKVRIENNDIGRFFSSIDSSIATGIIVSNYKNEKYSVTINANKLYDISTSKPAARVAGIYSYLFEPLDVLSGRRISMYNNIVGDLRAPTAGNISRPSIAGIFIENNTVKDTIDMYNNTIDVRASSSNPAFSTAALFTDTLAAINNYGNIFNNISTPGAAGKTVSHWRSGPNFSNFFANYNSLYAGSPATNRLIYFDGTNSDQTFAAYKTRSGVELLSVTELPVFVSTTGVNSGFLHLDPTANCGLIGKIFFNYSFPDIALDFDKDQRLASTSIDIGADETGKYNTWTGANSSSWNDPLNWSSGDVPNNIDKYVIIPAAPSNQPIIAVGEIFQVRSLIINTLASLTNRGTLKVTNSISAPVGSINNTNSGVVLGSIEMNSACSKLQTLNGNIFTGNNVNNLTINSEVTIPVTAGQGVNIWGVLNFGNGPDTLKTNGNLTLKSSVAGTASVDKILTGNVVNGDVTVERFINTGTSGSAHGKSWQLLATPTTSQTIRQAWQENGAAPAGFGTIINGTGTGFDITTAQASIKTYNSTNDTWTFVSSTNNALQNPLGYMLFVRGDRTVTTSSASANNTVLRSKGTLFQPAAPPPSVAVSANKFQTFGNPYASRIEFSKVRALSPGINDVFYVWDPKLNGTFGFGGYQTITGLTGYVPNAGSGTTYYPAGVAAPFIESGQAVFVRGNGTGGNVNFNETIKASGSRLVHREMNNIANRGFMFASLYTNSGMIADGNIVAFENGLSNALNDLDAIKIANGGENFGIRRYDSLLAVEARENIQETDTIFYHVQNLKLLPYQFRFAPMNLPAGFTGFLIDRFTNDITPVSTTDSSFVNFSITANVASQAADRFILVFKRTGVVSLKILSISANRIEDQTIDVQWKVNKEINLQQYEIERSADGSTFTILGHALPTNNNGGRAAYLYKDEQPLNSANFYRIKAIGSNGQLEYSDIVKVSGIKKAPSITVYPNPVVNNQINIKFMNQPAGIYAVQLNNALGQLVYSTSVSVNQTSAVRNLHPGKKLPSGTYQLSIIAEDGKRVMEKIIVP